MDIDLQKNIRLDKFLFFSRIVKSRSLASKLINKGHIICEGNIVRKPHKNVYVGNKLTIEIFEKIKIIKILEIPKKRESYSIAKLTYEDQTPIQNKSNTKNEMRFMKYNI